jgi:hypothetical protein
MATVTPPVRPFDREESQRRVRHPLQRLRGTIRLYVSAEGAAVLALYLALWFWIGLLLDYGLFKLVGVDWVQALPWEFRALVLCGLVAGLLAVVAVKVLLRLLREFRDTALALVLERRFPRQLGDRLITAVELADPRLAERYGYSQAMVDQTVQDAAAQVDQLPLQDVFDWKRLGRAGLVVAGLTVGVYLFLGLAYCLVWQVGPGDYVLRFHDVAAIWFERNVLLANTIWPRRAHLELVGFPESGELRVGRGAPPPTLRVRAVKWVLADARTPEGWRALTWDDLTPELLGTDRPPPLPADWRRDRAEWTVDQVELHLDKPEVKNALDADTKLALDQVLEALEERALSASMSRRLRQLEVPANLEVYYHGATLSSMQTLRRVGENEYSGVLSDLTESIRFTVRGEDYYTPYKRITVVPPPDFVKLFREEDQPAYLHHRVPLGGTVQDLRGKKQQCLEQPVSLTGETSSIEVPAGTDLRLSGETNKDVARIRILPRKGSADIKDPQPTRVGDRTFRCSFGHVTAPLDFDFEITDTDNVVGLRHMVIKPREDQAPEINDVRIEVVREKQKSYLVTPSALIPFSGTVLDDRGLDSVEFAYTLNRLESEASAGQRAARRLVSAIRFLPGGPGHNLLATAYLTWLAAVEKAGTQEEQSQPPQKVPVAAFVRRARERAGRDVPVARLQQLLHEKLPPRPAPKDELKLDADDRDMGFDLAAHLGGIRVTDPNAVQPRYRMRLWLVASDNNIETGPRTSRSKETFTVLVVSETELLAEVAKDEENLHAKLERAFNKILDGKNKLQQRVLDELSSLTKAEQLRPMAGRSDEIVRIVVESSDTTREVYTDYKRLLKELITNRVNEGMINKVRGKICEPLDLVLAQEFVRAEESLRDFHKVLENRKADEITAADRQQMDEVGAVAKRRLEELISKLYDVLEAMEGLTTINKLINQLLEIEKAELVELERLQRLHDELVNELLGPVTEPKKEDKKP